VLQTNPLALHFIQRSRDALGLAVKPPLIVGADEVIE
jgi:hypothetical protein